MLLSERDTCISIEGEYSSHAPDDEYMCVLCGALCEEALLEELRKLRRKNDKLRQDLLKEQAWWYDRVRLAETRHIATCATCGRKDK